MDKQISFDLNKLYFVADFDYTLTTKDSQNCWSILSTIPNISENYIKKSRQNNDYYLPIEQDDSIDEKIKKEIMFDWYQQHTNLLIKYHLKEKDIIKISQSESLKLRKGVIELLTFTNQNNIPFIIVSAGISNIIEEVLKKHNCFFNNVYIISNIFKFKDGEIKSLRNKIIHPLNKDEIEIPTKIKEILKDRDEIIILGDNIGDTKIRIKENQKNLKVGFLNYTDNTKLINYKKHFDIVYSPNSSLVNLLNFLTKNKHS